MPNPGALPDREERTCGRAWFYALCIYLYNIKCVPHKRYPVFGGKNFKKKDGKEKLERPIRVKHLLVELSYWQDFISILSLVECV